MQLFKVSDKTILQYEDFKAIYASCLFFVQMFITGSVTDKNCSEQSQPEMSIT